MVLLNNSYVQSLVYLALILVWAKICMFRFKVIKNISYKFIFQSINLLDWNDKLCYENIASSKLICIGISEKKPDSAVYKTYTNLSFNNPQV